MKITDPIDLSDPCTRQSKKCIANARVMRLMDRAERFGISEARFFKILAEKEATNDHN